MSNSVQGATSTALSGIRVGPNTSSSNTGCLILNADDWGRTYDTTEKIKECFLHGAISSASAMVFMVDSERAAKVALDLGIDAGLHLNFTTAFSGCGVPSQLVKHQERTANYLRAYRFAQAIYNPELARSFEFVAAAQCEEFFRLFGALPQRVDGHHHMHLCANVLVQGLLPAGTVVRRNFSFQRGEKGPLNRAYRRLMDSWLTRSHYLTDYFFSLPPLEDARLRHIVALAREAVVEVETHPIHPEEYQFLLKGELLRGLGEEISIAQKYVTARVQPKLR